MPSISVDSKDAIQAALDGVTKNKDSGIPGLIFCAVSKDGKHLTQNVSGVTSKDKPKPITLDTVFWIASCTKMITGIACMQLVEQGKLSLDDHEVLYKVCPELKEKKVLEDGVNLSERKGEITLRRLLSHTAGFGYTFFDPRLKNYKAPIGWDEFSGDIEDYLEQPLVNQPGSAWEYGINIDWAGIAVERVSGMKLDDYFKKNIFEPLGIKNISFRPNAHMIENMTTFQQREVDGSTHDYDHPYRRAIVHANSDPARIFHSGGAGCFAKPVEYCQLLAMLLNDGTSPVTGNKILEKATVDEMFKNQIPEFPDYARGGVPAAKPNQTNPIPELYPQQGNPPQGWGLTWMSTIEPGPTGRGANTAWWAGIVNLFWWADREKGVAGIIASQIMPFGDPTVMGAWGACEKAIYDGLNP